MSPGWEQWLLSSSLLCSSDSRGLWFLSLLLPSICLAWKGFPPMFNEQQPCCVWEEWQGQLFSSLGDCQKPVWAQSSLHDNWSWWLATWTWPSRIYCGGGKCVCVCVSSGGGVMLVQLLLGKHEPERGFPSSEFCDWVCLRLICGISLCLLRAGHCISDLFCGMRSCWLGEGSWGVVPPLSISLPPPPLAGITWASAVGPAN